MMNQSKENFFVSGEIILFGWIRFYIGCDVCADWLHGSCMNITPEEAEKFEVYVCPRCSTEKKREFLNQPINNETKTDLLNLTDQLLVKEISEKIFSN